MIYDYIIIGAGPAGSTLGYCLQRQGANCLLIEKLPYKKEKVCGGLLTHTGKKMLEEIDIDCTPLVKAGGRVIHSFIVKKNFGLEHYTYHKQEYGLGIRRQIFDNYLLQQAISVGAQFSSGETVRNFRREKKGIFVNSHRTQCLVLATGACGLLPPKSWSILQRQSFGISAQITGKTSLADDEVIFYYLGNGLSYFWLIPIGEKCWNIGIWFSQIPSAPLIMFHQYIECYVIPRFINLRYLLPPRGGYCGNVDLTKKLKCPGVGDVAGTNNPKSGEGLRYAIESAIRFTLTVKSHVAIVEK